MICRTSRVDSISFLRRRASLHPRRKPRDETNKQDPAESYNNDADPSRRCDMKEENEVGVDRDFGGEESTSHIA